MANSPNLINGSSSTISAFETANHIAPIEYVIIPKTRQTTQDKNTKER